jgi:thymidylate synthase (FAD)
MTNVKLKWITPDAEALIVEMARVSNPESAAKGEGNPRLIQYLIEHKHWSPFEMASACFEITTTRDIARQILRHRSFSFQEFSQRYATTDKLPEAPIRDTRMQDPKNRQNSLETNDWDLMRWWENEQEVVQKRANFVYRLAIERGIAKEVARAILPEGLTTSRMYMSGTIRSWLHYVDIRTEEGTQKEHREIAQKILVILDHKLPSTIDAFASAQWKD